MEFIHDVEDIERCKIEVAAIDWIGEESNNRQKQVRRSEQKIEAYELAVCSIRQSVKIGEQMREVTGSAGCVIRVDLVER